jgi:hypothetical protein
MKYIQFPFTLEQEIVTRSWKGRKRERRRRKKVVR